uniref:Portal protein n=1 Tax=Siphoviridae sp. cthGz5 TaxID=2825613 RepID=A0A8S5VAE1_9CAUD|nr:MAG TPA: portal protein [Siphoviridae sp. cthGz5]
MFENLIKRLKGVMGKMFGYNIMKGIAGRDITMSQPMIDAINLWKDMICGVADWINEDKGITSLKLEECICREFADIALGEMEVGVDNPVLDSMLKNAIRDLNENLQDGLALGSFILKPLGGGRSEIVSADKFVPIAFDDEGKPSDIMFFTRKKVGENSWFTRVERHYFDDNHNLVIENRCYRSSSESMIGSPGNLADIDEWANIEPGPVVFPGMTKNDYGYFRVPLKNRVDSSPCGV